MPECSGLNISGWTGTVMETQGRGAAMKVILEWDSPALDAMPADYKQQCESQNMLYSMACLPLSDLAVEDDE